MHYLAPIENIGNREGWTAFQLQNPVSTKSLLFVYKLGREGGSEPQWRLKNLLPNSKYKITSGLFGKKTTYVIKGSELIENGIKSGISMYMGKNNMAEVITIERVKGR